MGDGRVERPEVLILGLREKGCKWGVAPFRLSRLPEDAGAAWDGWQGRLAGPGIYTNWLQALNSMGGGSADFPVPR